MFNDILQTAGSAIVIGIHQIWLLAYGTGLQEANVLLCGPRSAEVMVLIEGTWDSFRGRFVCAWLTYHEI